MCHDHQPSTPAFHVGTDKILDVLLKTYNRDTISLHSWLVGILSV